MPQGRFAPSARSALTVRRRRCGQKTPPRDGRICVDHAGRERKREREREGRGEEVVLCERYSELSISARAGEDDLLPVSLGSLSEIDKMALHNWTLSPSAEGCEFPFFRAFSRTLQPAPRPSGTAPETLPQSGVVNRAREVARQPRTRTGHNSRRDRRFIIHREIRRPRAGIWSRPAPSWFPLFFYPVRARAISVNNNGPPARLSRSRRLFCHSRETRFTTGAGDKRVSARARHAWLLGWLMETRVFRFRDAVASRDLALDSATLHGAVDLGTVFLSVNSLALMDELLRILDTIH